jgi:hypothetical protein
MYVSNLEYALMSGVADRESRSEKNQFPVPAGWDEDEDMHLKNKRGHPLKGTCQEKII